MKFRRFISLCMALALCFALTPAAFAAPSFYQHRNIVIITATDMSKAALASARASRSGGLAFDSLPGGELTGQKDNETSTIGLDGKGNAQASLLEAAQRKGYAVGIVAPKPFDPDPAVRARLSAGHADGSDPEAISAQMAALGIDVVLGASVPITAEERKDEKDLRETFKKASIKTVFDAKGMRETLDGKLWGLFSGSLPSTADRAKKALNLLSKSQKGFVLSIEVPAATAEQCLDFDSALAEVLAWAKADAKTLVIVAPSYSADAVAEYKAYTPYTMPAYPSMSMREIPMVAASVADISMSAATDEMFVDAKRRFEELGYKVLVDVLDPATFKLIAIDDDVRLTLPANTNAASLSGDKKTVGLIAYTGSKFFISQKAVDLLRNPGAN